MAQPSELSRIDLASDATATAAPPVSLSGRLRRPGPGPYLLAIVAPIATLALRLLADPWLGGRPTLIWFLVSIIAVAYRGGLGPGLLATAISATSTEYFLVQPAHSLWFPHVIDLLQWSVFSANGVMVSVLSERLHGARQRAEAMVGHLARAQAVLHDSEERLRVANQAAGIGTYDTDLTTGVAHFSPEMSTMLGLPRGVPITLDQVLRMIVPDDLAELQRIVAAGDQAAGDGIAHLEVRVERPDGELRAVSWSSRTFFDRSPAGPRAVRRVGACIDVTELRRAQRRLVTQNAVSRVLAEVATLREATPLIMKAMCDSEGWDFGAIWQLDLPSGSLRCSETWSRPGLALDELRHETRGLSFASGAGLPGRVWKARSALLWTDLSVEDNYARAGVALAAGLRSALGFPILLGEQVTGVIEFVGRRIPNADPKLLDMFDTIGRQIGAFFDGKAAEAERQRLEAQLRQAQKMEALGQLSGGIAHDFNNILTAIGANLQLALDDVGAHHPAIPSLRDAARATDRAVDLVRQILLFARREPSERRAIDLRVIGEQSVKLLRATLPAGVDLRFSPARDVPAVAADATQMQQVIMNLGTNAWHALERGSGRIDVTVEAADLDIDAARALPGRRPGRWVRLGVRDTGVGMDAATLEHIFEPFFTTKGPDRGTGLGLAVVHGIVASHNGSIAVASRPGGGTTFEVYLPPVNQGVAPRAPDVIRAPRGAGEHVLFIDDEPMLNRSGARVLERCGYRVTAFADPRAALEQLGRQPDDFALVITDMNMPDLSGLEVARAVRARRPDLPILLLSGNLAQEVRAEAAELGIQSVLQKPWTVDDLAEAVNRLVRAPRPPHAAN
jgi:signal transduction histidine kinase/ActR/RegA family two-component response regulator/PAS domain-containing protein